MATKDPTQRAVYEQKIEAYNKQIEKITKTNDPLKYEIDEVTGNPIDKVAPELPDLTVPIEGTDKKGVPVGEDVPAEVKGEPEKITQPIELSTDPSTPQVKSEGVVDNTTPKGNTSNVGGDEKRIDGTSKDVVENNKVVGQNMLKDEALKHKDSESLLRSGGFSNEALDLAAFGFTEESVKTMMPDELSIKWKDDMLNPPEKQKKSGLSKEEWAKTVDLSEPIDVSYDGKKFNIEDGHHRYYAAKILEKKETKKY